MALAQIRPWLTAPARCSRRITLGGSRSASTFWGAATGEAPKEDQLLETKEDWTRFQVKRTEYKALLDHFSEYGSTQTRENAFQPHHSLFKPPGPSKLTLSALLASGAHFGHSKSLMNPNFIPYAYGVRAGVTIIDLETTLPLLRRAANLVRAVAARDGEVVFVGTRPDLRAAVKLAASRMGAQGFHVGEKWLPGTLTNKIQMHGAGVSRGLRIIPDLVIFLNPLNNMHAIRECAIEHIPTIGIIDSNVDPRIVMYPIPANDESTRTAELIAGVLSIAGREGVALNKVAATGNQQQGHQRVREGRQRS
ncbi:hypothetical protein JAAARDRAFT_174720 [Jaapia argillacea MUCL 33604]|uniref:Ribosomal protein S2 n=1 Tax=Jaapia argillacea MUCL 33604 TaxID=933084 RepID=A0A067PXN1_9AGAM|nr:hypothetical protein JAAARDRAFT_174720 [Jaapia argillacea MUCL 33604]